MKDTIKNRAILMGKLREDPKSRTLPDGQKVTHFEIATKDMYKDDNGERHYVTQWHKCVAWGKSADIAEKFLEKDQEVSLEGKIIYRTSIDPDGNIVNFTEIDVHDMLMLVAGV